MELDEDENFTDDEILPEARVFEFRAQNILKLKYEALQELFNKPPEDLKESMDSEETEKAVEKPKKPPGRKPKTEKAVEKPKKPPGRKPKIEKTKEKVEVFRPRRSRRKAKAEDEDKDKDASPERNKRDGTPTEEDEYDIHRESEREASPGYIDDYSPPKKKVKRPRRRKAQNSKGSEDPENLISALKLPAVSKRRIKELEMNSNRHKRRIDLENERILSACVAESTEAELLPEEDIESEQSLILKIQFLSDISKIRIKLTEKFASIFDKVADMFNLQASEILLSVKDDIIKPTDTPQSLNLKFFDVIDCLPYKPSGDKVEKEATKFVLKMQSNDTRKKTDVHGFRFEKFEVFMQRYSKIRNIPMEKLSFEFDGEKIEGFETPEELEIESGSCIDVNVVVENSPVAANSDSDFEITAEIISESKRIDICELD